MKKAKCNSYCGVACVNGQCPNALDEMDRNSDTDEYACYHLEKKLRCKDCPYNKGCDDCCFIDTDMRIKKR